MFENSLLFPSQLTDQEKVASPSEAGLRLPQWRIFLLAGVLLSGILSTAWGTWLYVSHQTTVSAAEGPLVLLSDHSTTTLYIDVSGAVEHPGIYPVKEGDRVAAAIEAAGGIAPTADSMYVSSTLNLSAKLSDEEKIYIPFAGESSAASGETETTTVHATSSVDALVSINSATEAELDELPKVGPATATKIVNGRPYATLDELLSRNVIGESVFAEIQQLIKI